MKSVFAKYFGAACVLTAFAMFTSTADASVLFAQVSPMDTRPVPEPSTYVAGALMLIPLGAGMLRAYYKNRRK
jgi:hypothetical protein